jgi:L-lactate dehydrogenase (cytochrome)
MTFTNVEDFRVVARSKLPRSIFEYGDGGSYDEVTLRANRNDLERLRLGQRVMVDMSHRSMKTRIVGARSWVHAIAGGACSRGEVLSSGPDG